jgi:predicted DNA-binding protein YlxM (UPF0122 family)
MKTMQSIADSFKQQMEAFSAVLQNYNQRLTNLEEKSKKTEISTNLESKSKKAENATKLHVAIPVKQVGIF